ncbi:MAG: hypothetical protein HIU92_06235 [Proteobacteria bacterium]|nr:hypothetical protein [Pseudomonadota bacterium]
MKFRLLPLATAFVVASSAFTASFAQSAAVSEHAFDWIFFAIVGIPFVLALVELFSPDVLERMIRDPNRSGFNARHPNSVLERRDRTGV